MKKFEKSTLPMRTPMGGIRTSLTNEVTIFPNAPPMMIPTARSSTFPRIANVLNSFNMVDCSSLPRECESETSGIKQVVWFASQRRIAQIPVAQRNIPVHPLGQLGNDVDVEV